MPDLSSHIFLRTVSRMTSTSAAKRLAMAFSWISSATACSHLTRR